MRQINYMQALDKQRDLFISYCNLEKFDDEKIKEPIWFEPNKGKFLFMDTWQEWDVFDMIKKGQIRFIKRALHQGEWMLKFLYVHIDYEIDTDLIPRLILYRKKSNKLIQSYKCPFCYGNHRHGLLDGHRVAHCGSNARDTVTAINGPVLKRESGYIVCSIEP